MAAAMNKRKHERLRAKNVAAHLMHEGRMLSTSVDDISMSGIFVRTHQKLPVGLEVVVDLALSGSVKPLRVQGKVVRQSVRGRTGLAINFADLDGEARSRLETLIRSVGQRGLPPNELLDETEVPPEADEPMQIVPPAQMMFVQVQSAPRGGDEPLPLEPLAPGAELSEPGADPFAFVTPDAAHEQPRKKSPELSESARLKVQIKGLVMELGARDQQLAEKDRELETLRAEVERLREGLNQKVGWLVPPAPEAEVDQDLMRKEADEVIAHLKRMLEIAKGS